MPCGCHGHHSGGWHGCGYHKHGHSYCGYGYGHGYGHGYGYCRGFGGKHRKDGSYVAGDVNREEDQSEPWQNSSCRLDRIAELLEKLMAMDADKKEKEGSAEIESEK